MLERYRHRLRWLNGAGFALTLFFAAWLLVYVLTLFSAGFKDAAFPFPAAYAIVGGIALVAMIALLSKVIFAFVIHGADLGDWEPRMYLYGWTLAGLLFGVTQSLVLFQQGMSAFPHLPYWLSQLYWYFAVVSAAVFLLLLWVNAEGHHYPWEEAEPEEDYESEEYAAQAVED